MPEYWDLYDKDFNLTDLKMIRGEKVPQNYYHLVVQVWLKNKEGKYLISKRAENKTFPGFWETTGGAAVAGENSLQAALREVKEELGIELDENNGRVLWHEKQFDSFIDIWMFDCDCPIDKIKFQKEETCDAKYVSTDEILEYMKNAVPDDNGNIKEPHFMLKTYYPYIDSFIKLQNNKEYPISYLTNINSDYPNWEEIPKANIDIWLWKYDYTPKTFAQLAFSDKGLFIKMQCFEKDPIARHNTYGEEVWVDSAMECFFGFEKNGIYVNCEMNSKGNCLIGVGDSRFDRKSIDDFGICPKIDAHIEDGFWWAQTFFSNELLTNIFGDFTSYNCMYGNFFKVGEETLIPHYGMWNPIKSKEPDFHRPECFGKLLINKEN